jgi:predicted enzyme related to lactoylglutathione lyase
MFTVTKYPHGTFGWADCTSTDASKAKPFYEGLMGWRSNDLPIGGGMVYTMFEQDGHSVTAISQMDPAQQAQGMPSHWNTYINVDDVDAVTGRVAQAGGTVLVEPMDVLDSGRMSVVQDPTGAAVGLWQARNHIGAGLVNTPGAMTWNELATRDAAAAKAFFGTLLGWTYEKMADMDYHIIHNKGRMNGGIMQMTDAWGDLPPHWMVYFSVKDIDEAAARVRALGGIVHVEKSDTGTGSFLVMSDPAGAVCSLIQLNAPDPWVE